ncbi:hypothetical protein [Paraburkholderia sp. Ac-20347]|uniref:hypothetical protein n=1 Tax=Paraburkholderia sp. Ac-20347 TaxID=2703892 RepID=UPI00198049E3|nr:hypothetical protein [Paraburkholderia sp. Ac-20347]MBN3809191.1 hypothetical protein [Paraburkholderia sp. Ac-20347]
MPRDWRKWMAPSPSSMSAAATPFIPLGFRHEGGVLRYLPMVTQELQLECLFPADDETEMRHRDWIADAISARTNQYEQRVAAIQPFILLRHSNGNVCALRRTVAMHTPLPYSFLLNWRMNYSRDKFSSEFRNPK